MIGKAVVLSLALAALVIVLSGCAKDALKGAPEEADRIRITATFDKLNNQLYYFFVFNFSSAGNPTEENRPEHLVSGPDRGRNWEFYIVYHHFGGFGPATWEVLSKEQGDSETWIDELPQPLEQQLYFLDVTPGRGGTSSGNKLTIELDPLELLDVNNVTPTKFLLDIMTSDTGVDKQTNPEDLGYVYDWLDEPVVVNIQVDEDLREKEFLIEDLDDSILFYEGGGSDLIDWTVQVT